MLQQEFESRLGRQLKDNENFNTIHDIDMASSLEKDAFTEEWKKKDHGCLLENLAANWLRTVDLLDKERANGESLRHTHKEWRLQEGFLWAEEAHEMSSSRARSRAIEILGIKGYLAYVLEKEWTLWEVDRIALLEIVSK